MSPTNVKLGDIFKGVEIPDELSEVLIYQTSANSAERSMVITVAAKNVIPYGVIEDFKKLVCRKFNLSGFIMRVKYFDIDISAIDMGLYFSNLIFYVNELIPGVRHIFIDSYADFADGKFTVHCKYGTNMIEQTNCADMMKRLVKSQLN